MVEIQVQAIVRLITKNDTPVRVGDLRIRRKVISFPRRRRFNEWRVKKEYLVDLPCYQLPLTNHPDCSLMWIRDMRGDDISLSKWQAQRCWYKKREAKESSSKNHGSDLDASWRCGKADVGGEQASRTYVMLCALYIYFRQEHHVTRMTSDKSTRYRVKLMVARQEAEIDRSFGFDTCLASFLPEVTGRLETRPKRPLGKIFSLEYII